MQRIGAVDLLPLPGGHRAGVEPELAEAGEGEVAREVDGFEDELELPCRRHVAIDGQLHTLGREIGVRRESGTGDLVWARAAAGFGRGGLGWAGGPRLSWA
jgi:hypothetical protein